MATIISSIVVGTRIQPVSEGYETSIESSKDHIDSNNLVRGAVTPHLKIGVKSTDYKAHESILTRGSLIGGITLTSDPRYRLLSSAFRGERLLSTHDRGHFSDLAMVSIINKTYTAISTHGIGYVPVTIEKTENNLRRWPRNWFGDNIKN